MPVIGRSFGILIESIIFATDFSPASKGQPFMLLIFQCSFAPTSS